MPRSTDLRDHVTSIFTHPVVNWQGKMHQLQCGSRWRRRSSAFFFIFIYLFFLLKIKANQVCKWDNLFWHLLIKYFFLNKGFHKFKIFNSAEKQIHIILLKSIYCANVDWSKHLSIFTFPKNCVHAIQFIEKWEFFLEKFWKPIVRYKNVHSTRRF